ncbi:GTP-binding protein [Rheinheimera sp.]|uniref:GTP-binding protein n=1 Tax=Rheinheimera sp. TaxID=1869214 RepID=UPI0023573D46|nr:GTP-binding protein [Rheinheimera sp.]
MAGLFWQAVPAEQWPQDADMQQAIILSWAEPYGARRQELVFIGQKLNKNAMLTQLEACLLTDAELALGEAQWCQLADPFTQ